MSSYAFQGAKHHAGAGRNVASVKAVQGAVKATNGAIDVAAAGDPTVVFGQLGAKAFGKFSKLAKKGGKAWMQAKENRFAEKLEQNDQLARGGDQKAMKWMLGHDPKMASASMLMHAQDANATDDQRSEAAARAGHVLRLGDEGQQEMKTGRLDQFDKIYANRTGRKMNAKTSRMGGFAQRALGTAFRAWDGTVGKAKHARRDRKEAKYGMNAAPHLQAVEDEYNNVRSFRANKQLDELEDDLQQQHLAEAYAGQQGGTAGIASERDVWANPNGLSTEKLIKARNEEAQLDGAKNSKVNKKLHGVKGINEGVLADMVTAFNARHAPPTLGPPPNRPPPPIPVAPAPTFGNVAPTGAAGAPLLGNQRNKVPAFAKATPDTAAPRGAPLLGARRGGSAPPQRPPPPTPSPAFTGATPDTAQARSPWLGLGRGKG